MTRFILGAQDPEMNMIEDILSELSLEYVYARNKEGRVSPSGAYDALNIGLPNDVLIECGGLFLCGEKIDHHRPGDPGFNLGPDKFLAAASIGQVISYVLKNDFEGTRDGLALEEKEQFGIPGMFQFMGHWEYSGENSNVVIPQLYVVQAAADHCLGPAYRGKCPGVNFGQLKSLQMRNIAKRIKSDVQTVHKAIARAEEWLDEAPKITIDDALVADLRDKTFGTGYSLMYLAIKEAGVIKDQPYLIKHRDEEGMKEKTMLNAASPELAKHFIEEYVPQNNLKNPFGSPMRGYAGAYK